MASWKDDTRQRDVFGNYIDPMNSDHWGRMVMPRTSSPPRDQLAELASRAAMAGQTVNPVVQNLANRIMQTEAQMNLNQARAINRNIKARQKAINRSPKQQMANSVAQAVAPVVNNALRTSSEAIINPEQVDMSSGFKQSPYSRDKTLNNTSYFDTSMLNANINPIGLIMPKTQVPQNSFRNNQIGGFLDHFSQMPVTTPDTIDFTKVSPLERSVLKFKENFPLLSKLRWW